MCIHSSAGHQHLVPLCPTRQAASTDGTALPLTLHVPCSNCLCSTPPSKALPLVGLKLLQLQLQLFCAVGLACREGNSLLLLQVCSVPSSGGSLSQPGLLDAVVIKVISPTTARELRSPHALRAGQSTQPPNLFRCYLDAQPQLWAGAHQTDRFMSRRWLLYSPAAIPCQISSLSSKTHGISILRGRVSTKAKERFSSPVF